MCITPALQVKDGAEMGSLALTIHSVQLLSINFIEVLSQKKKKERKAGEEGRYWILTWTPHTDSHACGLACILEENMKLYLPYQKP